MKGGDVDDAPPSLPHHFGHEGLSEEERRGKIEPQRVFPNLGREFVPRLARIQPGGIDEDVRRAERLGRFLGEFRQRLEFAHIEGNAGDAFVLVRVPMGRACRGIGIVREMAALLLAVGIDPEQHVLFVQSHVPAHCELSWVLACNTQFGELSRMTQFKDKSAKHPDNVNGGLFTYPVLMAADILIYNADLVPVGQDQTQHLEIARTIANRFNGIYGDTFTLPAGYVPKAGAKIMSLAEPTKKMSKSDTNANAFVLMTDDKDTIVRKFKRAVTDSDGVVRFDAENKPGVSNLMTIYSTFTGKDLAAIEAEFAGKGYGDFKLAVAEVTADALAPVQAEYGRILADKAYVDSVLKSGAERAARLANRTVSKVYRKVGLMQLDK